MRCTTARHTHIALVLALMLIPGFAHARVIVVTPRSTIQGAIDRAVDGDTILVLPGTYHESVDLGGKAVQLVGLLGAEHTIIDPQRAGPGLIVANRETVDTLIAGLTFTNGLGVPHDGVDERLHGGGAYIVGASPVIRRCIFTNNSAWRGGAMFISDSSDPLVEDCDFFGNAAEGGFGWGGAIMIQYDSRPVIRDCTFQNNTSIDDGGAIFVIYESYPVVENCDFTQNAAEDRGGAIWQTDGRFNPRPSQIELRDCRFVENTATSGGAVYVAGHSASNIARCEFIRNSAEHGGAVHISGDRHAGAICESVFLGNRARGLGGGVRLGIKLNPTIQQCMFVGNEAGDQGGAIMNQSPNLRLASCTMAANAAEIGADIYNMADGFVISNSILASVPATMGLASSPAPGQVDGIAARGIFNCVTGGWFGEGIGNFAAQPAFVRAPSPGTDGSWGTSDDDYGDLYLSPSSPCIDAGASDSGPRDPLDLDGDADLHEYLPVDADQAPRYVDAAHVEDTGIADPDGLVIDVGAYEFGHHTFTSACDLDGNGLVDVADLLQFLDAWLNVDIDADVDGDARIDVMDLLEFIQCWHEGA